MPSRLTRRRLLGTFAGTLSAGIVGSAAARRVGNVSKASSTSTIDGTDQPSVAWSHEFGSSGNDEPVDGVAAHDAGVVVLIAARGATDDVWLAKFSSTGTREWTRKFELWGHDDPLGIVRTVDGYVVAGYGGRGDHRHKPWLLAVRRDGSERWRRRYGSDGRFQVEAFSRSHDGGFVLGGHVDRGTGNEDESVWVMRTDADGEERWFRTYLGGFAWLTDIAPARRGGYVFVGHSHVGAHDGRILVQATIASVDESGNERWRRTFGGAGSDRLRRVFVTPDGYVVAGDTNSPAEGGGLLMALDRRGRTIWHRVFPDAGVHDLSPVGDGYALVGRDRLARTDAWGRVAWSVDIRVDGLRTVTRSDDRLVVGARTSYRGQDTGSQAWVGSVPLR